MGTAQSADGAPVELVLGQLIEGHPRIEHQAIPLVGTLQQSLAGVFAEWDADQGALPGVNAWCAAVISLLLYICEGDDIQGRGHPGNPEPTRTRRDGWRLFPAQGVRMWDVGVRMGAALRAAYQAAETDQGGTHAGPRGHVRRAHWHGYWSGPMKDKDGQDIPRERRKFDLRWQPPIAVNLPDIASLPATIRKVSAPPATP
ncbi:hypothetical protein [Comamonas serinivorans]|uniref:hypothetical protein n=1 Tax=Comamonas serinivorans TaxID=1082851 RepID=UPI001F32FF26|nr:hypothetical protein [Comamonas serinivorans]